MPSGGTSVVRDETEVLIPQWNSNHLHVIFFTCYIKIIVLNSERMSVFNLENVCPKKVFCIQK